MKWILKKHINFFIIFIFSIIIFDIFLGFIFEKDIKNFQKYEVKVTDKSNMWIVSEANKKELKIINYNWYPYWEMDYRGPLMDFKKSKWLNCRVLWMWGSTIWGAWVPWNKTYLYNISQKFKNTEFINISIPWSMPLQQIIRLEKEWLLHDTDLLFWDIWHDDFIPFVYSNWILYNSKIVLNNKWKLSLFQFVPDKINTFLINYSLLYNKLLKIKIKNNINNTKENDVTKEYILEKIKEEVEKYLAYNKDNKVVFLMHPYLGIKSIDYESRQHEYMKKIFTELFKNNERVIIMDLYDSIKSYKMEEYNLDDVHFNISWHNIVWNKLYEFIKTNKLLDDKCY